MHASNSNRFDEDVKRHVHKNYYWSESSFKIKKSPCAMPLQYKFIVLEIEKFE